MMTQREAIVTKVVEDLSPAIAKAIATWFEEYKASETSDALDAGDMLQATAFALANAFASSLALFERRHGVALNDEQIVSLWGEALEEFLNEHRQKILTSPEH